MIISLLFCLYSSQYINRNVCMLLIIIYQYQYIYKHLYRLQIIKLAESVKLEIYHLVLNSQWQENSFIDICVAKIKNTLLLILKFKFLY